MPFLKNKIHLANEVFLKNKLLQSLDSSKVSQCPLIVKQDSGILLTVSKTSPLREQNHRNFSYKTPASPDKKTSKSPPLKNITVNYGNAMATFALSYLAIPYLRPLLAHQGITTTDFSSFLTAGKSGIKSIHGLRSLLLVESGDSETMAACKRVFQYACEVFIKFFSVNWIMHSRLQHKMEYVRFRFKMLRRVLNPEKFTCIQNRG